MGCHSSLVHLRYTVPFTQKAHAFWGSADSVGGICSGRAPLGVGPGMQGEYRKHPARPLSTSHRLGFGIELVLLELWKMMDLGEAMTSPALSFQTSEKLGMNVYSHVYRWDYWDISKTKLNFVNFLGYTYMW